MTIDSQQPGAVAGSLDDSDHCAAPTQPDTPDCMAVRLRNRYPEAPPALIRRSIDDATCMFSDARVRLFLPILIERVATTALRQATEPRGNGARFASVPQAVSTSEIPHPMEEDE